MPVPDHEHHSAADLAAIAATLGIRSSTATDVPAALRDLANDAPARVLILGSLYLAGEVLAANDELPD